MGRNKHVIKSHTADSKSKQCELCEKSYAFQDELDKHMKRIHERKFVVKCNICDKELISRATLPFHINEVHKQIRKFKCEICNDQFVREYVLKKHKEIVHKNEGREKEKCKICDFYCMSKYMNQHMKRRHKD